MAAAIKALNAKIRSNPTTDYLCSTRTFTFSLLSLLPPAVGSQQQLPGSRTSCAGSN